MKRLVFIGTLLTLCFGYCLAQCGMNEIELKVEISTDPYGNETYWTLTDLNGMVVLQGGQGGVYQSNTSYADSICVLADGCYFFKIYDTYGDGIIAPNGYRLYVNEILVSNGADDIKSYAAVTASCPAACNMTMDALNDLKAHINGTKTLNADELTQIKIYLFYSRIASQKMNLSSCLVKM